jgi:hypothetical protein
MHQSRNSSDHRTINIADAARFAADLQKTPDSRDVEDG